MFYRPAVIHIPKTFDPARRCTGLQYIYIYKHGHEYVPAFEKKTSFSFLTFEQPTL